MAGEGFSKHASTVLRENRNLRRKKSMFKKERTFLNHKSSEIKTHIDEVVTKKPSKYELSKIRTSVLQDRRKEVILSVWIVLICAFLLWVFADMAYKSQAENVIRSAAEVEVENFQEKLDKYNYLISSGDEWYESEKYYNAAFQYRLALEIFPNDTVAYDKLISAYDLNCMHNNRNCGKSQEVIESFKQLKKPEPNSN